MKTAALKTSHEGPAFPVDVLGFIGSLLWIELSPVYSSYNSLTFSRGIKEVRCLSPLSQTPHEFGR
jgi:hypothetical protein